MSRTENEVCIVIPHYREELSRSEQASLDRCVSVLAAYPTVLVKPRGMPCRALRDAYPMLRHEDFADECFRSVADYNRLMLSDAFYARFAAYRYILVYQLDAYVFSDQLLHWCRRGYDYVGAPWIPYDPLQLPLKQRMSEAFDRRLYRLTNQPNATGDGHHDLQYYFQVGNGGFSLRRVARLREVLRQLERRADPYRHQDHYTYNEDVFFGVEANRYWPNLKIPHWRRALEFSWEWQPAIARQINGGALPFGCHAWNKLYLDDWRTVFAAARLSLDEML